MKVSGSTCLSAGAVVVLPQIDMNVEMWDRHAHPSRYAAEVVRFVRRVGTSAVKWTFAKALRFSRRRGRVARVARRGAGSASASSGRGDPEPPPALAGDRYLRLDGHAAVLIRRLCREFDVELTLLGLAHGDGNRADVAASICRLKRRVAEVEKNAGAL